MKTPDEVATELKRDGFDGLYYPGECACLSNDLAPCGEWEEGGDYVNGCDGGYKHIDPKDETNWCVSVSKEQPDEETWENYRL